MTPEQQRIAIAEACGWTRTRLNKSTGYLLGIKPRGGLASVPDYLNDLNAMHCAENRVKSVWGKYVKQLNAIADPACATAAQRAEAFLRTLGLWKE